MKRHQILSTALLMGILAAPAANAALTFTFDRISDTQATLTATGLVGLGFPTGVNIGVWEKLELRGPMTNAGPGPALGSVAQTPGVSLGGTGIQGWTVFDGDLVAFPSFTFGDLSPLTGTSTGTASGNIEWLPVGFTGDVFATYFGQDIATEGLDGVYKVGTWQIVPEPSSLALLGLGGLGLLRRRR